MAVSVGDALPPMTIKAYAGHALDNDALNGKVTLVNFWATWCAACKIELVEMEDQLKPYLTDAHFQLAFVSLDKDTAKAVEWFHANLKEPDLFLKHLYFDPSFVNADKLKLTSFPTTFVTSKTGQIAYEQKGFTEGEGSTAKMTQFTATLLKR